MYSFMHLRCLEVNNNDSVSCFIKGPYANHILIPQGATGSKIFWVSINTSVTKGGPRDSKSVFRIFHYYRVKIFDRYFFVIVTLMDMLLLTQKKILIDPDVF